MSLQGKVVLITGAGSGMGRLAAQRFSKQGAKVAALDINEVGLKETAAGHDNITTFKLDVTNIEQVNSVVADVISKLGNIKRIFICAAIMPFGKLLDHDAANIKLVMDINYGGTVNVTKAALPNMIANGGGDCVVFSSMLGQMPILAAGAYCASKFATSAYTEILAHENRGKNVRFACVCPPVVNTPLLKQAKDTVWPKILDENPHLDPSVVIDSIEKSLKKGEFWVFPGRGTKIGYVVRRLMPEQIWKHVHKTEGW
jgi:NAD(P)-dependent dehydrogenase (short-subunit alcohol dehydrogenase family)